MHNLLAITQKCPRCNAEIQTDAEFKMGMLNLDTYKIGERLKWSAGKSKPPHQKRPVDGTTVGEGYVCCPKCDKDYWITIRIENDAIVSADVDVTKEGYIK